MIVKRILSYFRISNFEFRISYIILTIALLIISLSSPVYSDIYKWVDDQGNIHYSDDYYGIPERYRSKIKDTPSSNNGERQGISRPQSGSVETPEKEVLDKEGDTSVNTMDQSSRGTEFLPGDIGDIEDITDNRAVTLIKGMSPGVDKSGNALLSGKVKNNTGYTLSDIEITFHLYDSAGRTIDVVYEPVAGAKQEGVLAGGETGKFNIETFTPLTKVKSYKYFITWKGYQ